MASIWRLGGGECLHTLTITSMEKAVTASSHVDGECLDQSTDRSRIGAMRRKAQTQSARTWRFREGFRAALSDIRIGATMLCRKCSSAVISRQKFRQSRMKRLSGDSDVRPVCSARM